jgi:hypothetical protein
MDLWAKEAYQQIGLQKPVRSHKQPKAVYLGVSAWPDRLSGVSIQNLTSMTQGKRKSRKRRGFRAGYVQRTAERISLSRHCA